jgi:hypothetical protein
MTNKAVIRITAFKLPAKYSPEEFSSTFKSLSEFSSSAFHPGFHKSSLVYLINICFSFPTGLEYSSQFTSDIWISV